MKLTLIICFLLFIPGYVFAHGDHEATEIQAKDAKEISMFVIKKLVEKEKLGESWLRAKVNRVSKKEVQETSEWVVSVLNEEEPDQAKKTLYVFLSLDGQYLGANHTGK